MKTPKQDIAFPDAALIRKGTPKQKMNKTGANGPYVQEIQGKNLDGQGFRIHFAPGAEDAVAAWDVNNSGASVTYDPAKFVVAPNERNYIVKGLSVIVPTRNVWDSVNGGLAVNEAYSAGRRVAVADDEKYIDLRDPMTGEYLVKAGVPFKKFIPGDLIKYERGGKVYELKMKTSVRMRLVVKDMIEQGQLVQFILKTTSWYDWQNIKKQLAGIQAIAETANGGNAAGVPFKIYRLEQEIVWNKVGGSAQRMKQWLVNIQPDPEWVKAAFARMGKFALTGTAIAGALMPSSEIEGEVNPDAEEDETENGFAPSDVLDGKVEESEIQEPIDPLSKASVKWYADQFGISAEQAAEEIKKSDKFTNPMEKSKFKRIVMDTKEGK